VINSADTTILADHCVLVLIHIAQTEFAARPRLLAELVLLASR